MRRRCVPLGIIAGLGVLMLLLLPVQAQAKRRSVQANSVSALERATKKLEKTGGIIWLGNRTYRLKKEYNDSLQCYHTRPEENSD